MLHGDGQTSTPYGILLAREARVLEEVRCPVHKELPSAINLIAVL